jgi:hypothetical protein
MAELIILDDGLRERDYWLDLRRYLGVCRVPTYEVHLYAALQGDRAVCGTDLMSDSAIAVEKLSKKYLGGHKFDQRKPKVTRHCGR